MRGDTKEIATMVALQSQQIGPDFTAYTERDGYEWYLIAGNRESWHGSERVADTCYIGTRQRDKARALLLFMMGIEGVAGMKFERVEGKPTGFSTWADQDGRTSTIWNDAAARVFPEFAAKHGLCE